MVLRPCPSGAVRDRGRRCHPVRDRLDRLHDRARPRHEPRVAPRVPAAGGLLRSGVGRRRRDHGDLRRARRRDRDPPLLLRDVGRARDADLPHPGGRPLQAAAGRLPPGEAHRRAAGPHRGRRRGRGRRALPRAVRDRGAAVRRVRARFDAADRHLARRDRVARDPDADAAEPVVRPADGGAGPPCAGADRRGLLGRARVDRRRARREDPGSGGCGDAASVRSRRRAAGGAHAVGLRARGLRAGPGGHAERRDRADHRGRRLAREPR